VRYQFFIKFKMHQMFTMLGEKSLLYQTKFEKDDKYGDKVCKHVINQCELDYIFFWRNGML
jgi:hypothetical protein